MTKSCRRTSSGSLSGSALDHLQDESARTVDPVDPLPSDGYLIERSEGAHVWVVPDGRRLAFHGSFLTRIDIEAVDARSTADTHPELYDATPGGSDATRAFVDTPSAASVVYDSLRDAGGECLAVLRPDAVTGSIEEASTLRLAWSAADGWTAR